MAEAEFSSVTASELGSLARLAAAMAHPFDIFDRSGWSLGALSPDEVVTLARDPRFGRPIARAVAANASSALLPLSSRQFTALASSGAGRLAILMLCEPLEQVEEAALLCTAAAMQKQVLGAIVKADRQKLRQAFGQGAYQLATQEAPMLYPGLAALGDTARFQTAMAPDLQPEQTRLHLVDFGMGLLLRTISASAPALADMVARRLPPERRPRSPEKAGAIDLKQFTKLIDRRLPQWSAIIG